MIDSKFLPRFEVKIEAHHLLPRLWGLTREDQSFDRLQNVHPKERFMEQILHCIAHLRPSWTSKISSCKATLSQNSSEKSWVSENVTPYITNRKPRKRLRWFLPFFVDNYCIPSTPIQSVECSPPLKRRYLPVTMRSSCRRSTRLCNVKSHS